jgi:hypothetical protein
MFKNQPKLAHRMARWPADVDVFAPVQALDLTTGSESW